MVFIRMELCAGGDLRKFARRQPGGVLAESHAVVWATQLLFGLCDMLSVGVLHRDVKPENLLLTKDGSLRIADFGWAADLAEKPSTLAGTFLYMAPEVLEERGPQTGAVDVWSAGATLLELMTGITLAVPLETRLTATDPHGANRIRRERLLRAIGQSFPPARERRPACISRACWDLIRAMLDREPTQRISAATALSHPWVSDRQRHQSKSVSPDRKCSGRTLAPSGAQPCCQVPGPSPQPPSPRDIAMPTFSVRAPVAHETSPAVPPQVSQEQCEGLRGLLATPPVPSAFLTPPHLQTDMSARRAESQPAMLVPPAQTPPCGDGNVSVPQTPRNKHKQSMSDVSTAVPSERGSPPATPPSPEPRWAQTALPHRATIGHLGPRSASGRTSRNSPVHQVPPPPSPRFSRRTALPPPGSHRAQSGTVPPWPGHGNNMLYCFGGM